MTLYKAKRQSMVRTLQNDETNFGRPQIQDGRKCAHYKD